MKIFPVLAFFVHLILPFLGGEFKVVGVLNKAFYRYMLRVCAFHTKLHQLYTISATTWSPLQYAASMGNLTQIQTILKRPEYLNQLNKTDYGTTDEVIPLIYAAENGHERVCRLLMKKFRSMLKVVSQDHVTAVHVAAMYGRVDMMKKFLWRCPRLKMAETKITKETPLFHALMGESRAAVTLLLRLGADKMKKKIMKI